MKKQYFKYIILIVLGLIIVFAIYLKLTGQKSNQTEQYPTELELLMQQDLSQNYPKTPRDVVKMHRRILKVLYNEKLKDEEISTLNDHNRKLMSVELLLSNSEEQQLQQLQEEMQRFKDDGKIFISYTIQSADSIQVVNQDGKDYTTVDVVCTIKQGNSSRDIQEQYLLVKEQDQWKILGWQGIAGEEPEEGN